MAKFIHVRALKNQITALLREVENGTTLIVTRRGKPIATLRPFEERDLQSAHLKYPTTIAGGRWTEQSKGTGMILLDSNIFIIDRFFRKDTLYPRNRTLFERLGALEAAISVFTLLEICGVASFNLSSRELKHWLYQFPTVYSVLVLDPFDIDDQPAAGWVRAFLTEVSEKISQNMTFGDTILVREAEKYRAEAIITWNTKDFLRRTSIPVFTPESYLK